MAEQQVAKKWYKEFIALAKKLKLESALKVVEEMDKVPEDKETDEDVNRIQALINSLELTPAEVERMIKVVKLKKDKYVEDAEGANEYVKGKLERNLRLMKNRVQRTISEDFGNYLRYLREQRGYSYQALFERTGISPSYINRIEKGERKAPSYPVLEKLADALGVDVSELLNIAGFVATESNIQGFPQVIYSNAFTINAKIVSSKQKQLIVDIVTEIDSIPWTGESKYEDTLNIMKLVEKYKELTATIKK